MLRKVKLEALKGFKRGVVIPAVTAVCILVLKTVAFAGGGMLTGTVVDKYTGNLLVGAKVLIRGTELVAITQEDGSYAIANVPDGTYSVVASLEGYSPATKSDVSVFAGQEVTLDFQLVPEIFKLEEVVVTATRTERAVKDLSATVSVITREEIEASNANSCTDILNIQPGLFVHKTGPFGRADVDIRGIGNRGRKVMVLIDGRPVKMGLFGCTVTHSLPINNVERIEAVRGPLSVLYGSDALGGAINIITRQAGKRVEADFTTSYGTDNTQHYRLRHGGYRGKFNYYLTGDLRSTDGHIDNSAYDGKDFTARVGYEIMDNAELTLTGKYFDGHKEEPLRATEPPSPPSDTWNDYERGAIDLTFTRRWERMNGFVKVYRNFGEHEFSDGWHSKDFTNGAMVNGSVRVLPNNELTVGVEFRQQGGEKLATAQQPSSWEGNKSEYAAYFHDEHTLFNKLTLTFGTRFNEDEVSGGEFCPQGGLVYRLREGTILRGSVNKGFRSPQLTDLYLFPPSNEDLKPEVVWNYGAGVNQQVMEGVNIDIVGYLMDGEDLIKRAPNPNPPPMWKFQNVGEFEFKGLETSLRAQMGGGLSGRISYTYLDPGEKTKGRPGDKLDLDLRYARDRVAVYLNGQYVTDYFAADNATQGIDDYFVANAKLSYELIRGLQAFLAVDNLLDEDYVIYADLPGGAAGLYTMPGRMVHLGLTAEL